MPCIVGLKLRHRRQELAEFILGIVVFTEDHNESVVIFKAYLCNIRHIDICDLVHQRACLYLIEDIKQIVKLRLIVLGNAYLFADLRSAYA